MFAAQHGVGVLRECKLQAILKSIVKISQGSDLKEMPGKARLSLLVRTSFSECSLQHVQNRSFPSDSGDPAGPLQTPSTPTPTRKSPDCCFPVEWCKRTANN